MRSSESAEVPEHIHPDRCRRKPGPRRRRHSLECPYIDPHRIARCCYFGRYNSDRLDTAGTVEGTAAQT